jgi:tRNA pseudouridine55 synthase
VTAPRPRLVRRAVHGVLLLDKALGVSSNAALQRAKRLYRAEKAGHTGTLDPLATGLLPLCFGAATKFAQISLDADKRYLATRSSARPRPPATPRARWFTSCRSRLASRARGPLCRLRRRDPASAANAFGAQTRRQALYDYARRHRHRAGTAQRHDSLDRGHGRGGRPLDDRRRLHQGHLHPHPGRGHQGALGCGAHLAALRRIGSGGLDIVSARSIESLETLSPAELDAALLPADALIADWPKVVLHAEDAGRFLAGVRRRLPLADAANVRVYGPGGAFLGSAHVAGGELIAGRLLSPAEVGAAFPAPIAASPRIEESESLPS